MATIDEDAGTRTLEYRCDGPATIELQLGPGRVELRTVTGEHVRVELSAGSAGSPSPPEKRELELLDETRIAWSERDRLLRVHTPGRRLRPPALAVLVEAPAGSRLTVRGTNAGVKATGTLGGLAARTHAGDVAAETVEGDVVIRTGSGTVQLGRVGGTLRIASGSGRCEVAAVRAPSKITTGRGDISLGSVESDVDARTGRGHISVANAGRGRISLVSGRGDVRVGVPPGVTAEIDAVSGSGQARSDLPVSTQPALDATLRLRVRTGSGEALVTPAKPQG